MKKAIIGTLVGALVILSVATAIFNEKAKEDEMIKITYKLGEEVVHTQKVRTGKKIGKLFVYETDNHQTYASTWKDKDSTEYTADTKVNKNITLYGEPLASLKLFFTPENEYTFVNGINHVHKDGKVVVLSSYYDKEIKIGNGAINNNEDIIELYLPNTIHQIHDDNFVNCDNLATIYFAGSEQEWNLIPTSSVIPESISLVFNTSY